MSNQFFIFLPSRSLWLLLGDRPRQKFPLGVTCYCRSLLALLLELHCIPHQARSASGTIAESLITAGFPYLEHMTWGTSCSMIIWPTGPFLEKQIIKKSLRTTVA